MEHDSVIYELIQWFLTHCNRQYGEVGFVVTKHEGHIVKVKRIDEERPGRNEA